MQDQGTEKMIGIGHESQGLYHLSTPKSSVAFTSTIFVYLIHTRLGHLSLAKLQKIVPSLFLGNKLVLLFLKESIIGLTLCLILSIQTYRYQVVSIQLWDFIVLLHSLMIIPITLGYF